MLLELALVATSAATPASSSSLEDMSLEQLLNIDLKVTSVSRQEEDLSAAPAAVYSVTAEEIRRIGATSIPEAVRVAPGVQVAQFDSSAWAVAARGMNGQFNNKMLVLEDGRTLYTSLFGGVWWDQQQMLLADVDHIEVIRGPGGAVWGANAINGVISVITKSAADTQGLYATAGGGTWDQAFGGVRWGASSGALHYRVEGDGFRRGTGVDAAGRTTHDGWYGGHGSFRADWSPREGSTLTVDAGGFGNGEDEVFTQDVPNGVNPPTKQLVASHTTADGAHALARFSRGGFQAQGYWDRADRYDIRGVDKADTWDLDLQHRVDLFASNTLIGGAAARATSEFFGASPVISLSHARRTDWLESAFFQDEQRVAGDRVRLIAGTKLEHNDFTGWELEPTLRASAGPFAGQHVWAALSRAIRTPDRVESDSTVAYGIQPGPVFVYVLGDPSLKSEQIVSYEGGWRLELASKASFDVAAYDNHYQRLIAVNPNNLQGGAPNCPPGQTCVSIPFSNETGGSTWGAEASARVELATWWTMVGSYAYERSALAAVNEATARAAPRNQASARAYLSPRADLDANVSAYYYDDAGAAPDQVTAFTRVDAGADWRPNDKVELSLWGQNLLQDHHPEIKFEFLFTPSEVSRGFYARATTRF